jgi:hypothetical protein
MPTIHYPLLSTSLNLTPAEAQRIPVRGRYQADFLHGLAAVSGSDLTGRARSYGARYFASRFAVIEAAQAAGIELVEVIGHGGRRSVWSVDALAALFPETAQ